VTALLISFAACAHAPAGHEREEIARVLDDFHEAAASADEERYFAHFAPDGIFLGTDATERWDVKAFRDYARPHFAKGKAWTFRGVRRRIAVRGDVAWFEEDLETQNLGPARGSGVLVRGPEAWRIAQYVLSITIPNDRFKAVRELLESASFKPPGQ
jgi:ketosteroid isomerase-like protein